MKSAVSIKSIFFILFVFLYAGAKAQSTYKVVCDKTDHQLKVVSTKNRSPKYVPIKGGFPFKQIAQKWINNNYSTTECNPEDLIDSIKSNGKAIPPTTEKQQQQPKKLEPHKTGKTSAHNFHNTSFIFNAKFSNIGKAFLLEKALSPGFGMGFEQLFGKKIYLGVGFEMDFLFADFSAYNYEDNFQSFYFGKFPIFLGHRSYKNNRFTSYQIGFEYNTVFQASNEDIEFRGKIPNQRSYDIMARFRIGKDKTLFTLGTEMWLSQIFKNNDFNLITIYLGLKINL